MEEGHQGEQIPITIFITFRYVSLIRFLDFIVYFVSNPVKIRD